MSLKDKGMQKAGDVAVNALDAFTKNVKAENKVAEFIEESMPKMFKTDEECGMERLVGFISKLFMQQANKDPNDVAKRLVEMYNDLGAFFIDVSKPENEKQTNIYLEDLI